MRVVVRAGGGAGARVIDVRDGAMTLAEVTAAGGGGWAPEVLVDGQRLPADTTVRAAGVLDGSEISPAPDPAETDPPAGPALVELHQIAGMGAGGSVALAAGRYDLGRVGSACDVLEAGVVDDPRLRLVVTREGDCEVQALASSEVLVDGILLDGALAVTDQHVQVGGAVFRLTPAMDRRRPSAGRRGDGLVVFDRPPPAPARAEPDRPPAEPPVGASAGGRGTGRAGVASPMAGTATRPAAAAGIARQELAELVWEAGQRLATGWRDALDQARAAQPDVAELGARARVLAPSLWQRRVGLAGTLEVGLGVGTGKWRPPASSAEVPIELAGIFQTTRDLPAVPMVGDLGAGPVGVIGPPGAVRAVARWLIVQAAVLCGPDVLSIAEASGGRTPEWGWLRWLPHFAPVGSAAHHLTVVDGPWGGVRDLVDRVGTPEPGRPCLVLAPGREQLPQTCVAIVQVSDDGDLSVHDRHRGQRRDGLAVGLSLEVATAIARDLAPIVLAAP